MVLPSHLGMRSMHGHADLLCLTYLPVIANHPSLCDSRAFVQNCKSTPDPLFHSFSLFDFDGGET